MTTSAESKLVDVAALQATLRQFAAERDWDQFHSPKNLAMALTGEVGELVEIFQWMPEAESRTAMTTPKTAEALNAEIADVFIYLSRLADVLGVDLDAAVKAKLASNAARYAVEVARGNSEKR
jgi:dCTP diphosphatase